MATRRVDRGVLPPFQVLLDEHAALVHRFLRATVGPIEADDVYQDTWISALRAYPRLRSVENLQGWLLTIAHRKAIDHLRARSRLPVPVPDLPEATAPSLAEGEPELWAAVRELPPKQRGAVAMRYALDLDYAAIGAALGCSEEAARRSVFEGLRALRGRYER